MIISLQNRATISKVMALGFLLATLVAMVLSAPPAGAAVTPSGKAFAWGYNSEGQLGNDAAGTNSDVPVAVKNLKNFKNIDGGYEFILAATQ